MMQIKTITQKVMWICLLFTLFGTKSVQAQGLDFSVLNDDNTEQSLSQTEKYHEALNEQKTWKSISDNSLFKWTVLRYSNSSFKLDFLAYKVSKMTTGFKTYLVSPALDLKALKGKQLSYAWKIGSPKGTCKMSVILIDKQGKELGKIDDVSANQYLFSFKKRTAVIPAVAAEKGFIAFVCEGDKSNRGYFEVQNIVTEEAAADPTLKVDPAELKFESVEVGQESAPQVINVTIENYDGDIIKPVLEGDAVDFSVATDDANGLKQNGGKITVIFKPTTKGNKKAVIKITVGNQTQEVALTGEAKESVVEEKPQVELLEDGFFWDFTAEGMPKSWKAVGAEVKKLTAGETYRNDGGFAVGIRTTNQKGYLCQVIDLKKKDKEVTKGDEVECSMKYKTVASPEGKAALHLTMRWTDNSGKLIECAEKNFIDNPKVFFGKMLAWGDLRFRTTCPAGATKLEFKVEVLENCEVAFDEFTAERIPQSYAQAHPLVAILPQVMTIYGSVGVPADYDIAIQSRNMPAAQAKFTGGGSVLADKVLKLDVAEISKNTSVAAKLTVTPTKKGAYTAGKAFKVSFNGADPEKSGSLILISYFMDKDHKPTLKLGEGVKPRDMHAEKGKTDSQKLTFTVEHEITDVYVKIEQDPLHAYFKNTKSGYFYYSSKSEKILGTPEMNITFTPLEAGTFKAKVLVTTVCGETLEIPIVGTCEEASTTIRTENFSEAPKGDKRFDGRPEWKGFGKYDLGWWHIDGKWNGASDVTLNKAGELYFDELLENGLITMKMTPKESAAKCSAEYSLDGGGHWKPLKAANAEGEFEVNTLRPTLVRFVNKSDGEIKINKVEFNPNPAEKRQKLDKIEDAIFVNADKEPLAKLDENFDNRRHTRILSIDGWQNFATYGDIPFRIWHQKADLDVNSPVESEGAYITFFKWGQKDERLHEAWLISPTLSYKKAASKMLTFRTRFSGLSMEERQQSFDAYIIAENEGKVQAYHLDLRKFTPFQIKIEENEKEWIDFRIDLEKLRKEFPIEDKFHIAFTQWSEHGGNYSNLIWMVDNVTFGRTDLPKISVDRDMFHFPFRKDVQTEDMSFNITTENAKYPVSVTLVPARMKSYFTLKTPKTLPAKGGKATFTYKSKDDKQHAAAYLIQTPGAEPVMVKLLATIITGIDNVNGGNEGLKPLVTENGIAIAGQYKNYRIYNAAGQILKQGGYEPTIDLSDMQKGIVILKVATDTAVKTFTLCVK